MLKAQYFCGLVACCYFCLTTAEFILGNGNWRVLNIDKCDDWEKYEMKVEVEKRRVNRSHDAFNAEFDTTGHIIDDSYACQINVCKFVDGGCKPYMVLADESFPRFIKKYGESNCVAVLEMAGIDPPWFPIRAGKIIIKKYLFDYGELANQGTYGEYIAEAYLLKMFQKVGCIKIGLEFSETEEEEE